MNDRVTPAGAGEDRCVSRSDLSAIQNDVSNIGGALGAVRALLRAHVAGDKEVCLIDVGVVVDLVKEKADYLELRLEELNRHAPEARA